MALYFFCHLYIARMRRRIWAVREIGGLVSAAAMCSNERLFEMMDRLLVTL